MSTDKQQTLEQLRTEIDDIDRQLVDLLNRRADLVLGVKAAKERGRIDIYSPAREAQILERVRKLAEGGNFPVAALERTFTAIISATRSLIGELSVGYLGPDCSPAYDAAVKQFGESIKLNPEPSVETIIRRVEQGDFHYGVVPIETSSTGLNMIAVEALYDSRLEIVAEVETRNRLAIIGKGPVAKDGWLKIKKIFGDAQSIGSVSQWLRINLPLIETVVVETTAEAAKRLGSDPSAAIIASESAAARFGLDVLAAGVENDPNSEARFVVIGFNTPPASGKDKTSLVVTAADRAGALRDILRPFADRGLTLLKIESKPHRKSGAGYLFLIDIAGHRSDSEVEGAISELSGLVSACKVLGSFPLAAPK